MSKRRADIELNQDNWDDDIPVVKPGAFEKADNNSIAGRKILKVTSHRTTKTGTSGLFKSFTGFSNTATVPTLNFNFGSKPNVSTSATFPTSSESISTSSGSKDTETDQETEYLKQLLTLNKSLFDWIGKHIKEDPYCILTPVFADYEKHLSVIHDKFPDHKPQSLGKTQEGSKATDNFTSFSVNGSVDADKTPTSLPSTTTALTTQFPLPDPKISTQLPSTESTTVPAKPFTFNLPPITTSGVAPLFKFGSTFPSTSPCTTPAAPSSTDPSQSNPDDDNEEYHPPKPEVKEIKEEGSVFTIRCKLFYKIDAEWRERGVGNLYIKPITSEKFQLLVRADTNLGNILLNILVTRDIPFKQQKNNLTFVCVPTPPLPALSKQKEQSEAPKPVPMLIRVKTEDNATELLNKLDEHRGLSKSADDESR